MESLLSTFLLILLMVAAAGVGRHIYVSVRLSFFSPLEELVFSVGLGLAVVAFITFALGLFGLLYEEIFRGILALLIILAILWNKDIFKHALSQKGFKGPHLRLIPLFTVFLLVILLANLSLNFLGALAPPTDGDGLSHVLTMPKSYIQAHQIKEFPDRIFNSYNPAIIEMLFTFSMLLNSDIMAQLLHFMFGLMTALAIYAFCVRFFFSRKIGLLSATIFYSVPTVIWLSTTAMEDLGYLFFTFMAVYGFAVWSTTNSQSWLLNSAVYVGLANGSKRLGLFSIGVLALMILLRVVWEHRLDIRLFTRSLLLFLAVAFIVSSPWLIRSYIGTGNPIYPFFYNVFGGKYLTPAFLESLGTGPTWVPERPPFWEYFRILWDSASGRYIDTGIDRFYSSKGPLFLALVPCLIFVRRIDSTIKILLTYAVGFSLFWFLFSPMPRYDIPIYAVLSIVAGYVAIRLASCNRTLTAAIYSALFLSLLVGVLRKPMPGVAATLQLKTKQQYLIEYAHLNYPVLRFANENLPKSAKLFLLWDVWGYYLERDYAWGHPPSTPWIDYGKLKDSRDFAEYLSNLGFTHLLVNEGVRYNDRARLSPEELALFDDKNPALVNVYQWIKELRAKSMLRLVFSQNNVDLYELISPMDLAYAN